MPNLRDHWVQECDKKDVNRQCQRCKDVVPENQFEKHTKDKKCKPNPNNEPVCPLCKTNIAKLGKDQKAAWIKHLIKDKCKSNPRK